MPFLHLLRCSCGFSFLLLSVVYHIDWLAYVEPSLWPWDKSILIVMILLIFVDLVCYYWLRIFASVFIEDTGLWFSFFVVCLFRLFFNLILFFLREKRTCLSHHFNHNVISCLWATTMLCQDFQQCLLNQHPRSVFISSNGLSTHQSDCSLKNANPVLTHICLKSSLNS